MLNIVPPETRPQPGVIRLVFITILCGVLMLGGLAASLTAYRSRTQIARGWEDATTSPDLPLRVPLAGVNVDLTQYDAVTLNSTLDQIAAAGLTWVRQPFSWATIEPSLGTFQWDAYDPLVKAVAAHPTLKLIALLDESPAWARQPGAEGSRYAPPSSPAQFGDFAGALAARYSTTISTYQIWDEPNLNTHWGGLDPAPAGYLAMLRAAYTAIHAAESPATVIAAALAPTTETGPHNLADPDYLDALYTLGGGQYFDAAAGKPYGFNSGPADRTLNPAMLNFSRIILLREVMVRHGDSAKPLWGSNFGWNSLPANWSGAPSIWGQVDAATQESYTHAAYARAGSEWPWLAGLILEHWQPNVPADDPIQGFAIAGKAAAWATDGVFQAGDGSASSGLESGLTAMTDPRVQYSGTWRTGPLGADVGQNADSSLSSFSVQIDGGTGGRSIGLRVRRDNYVAYLYVTLDGQPVDALPTDTQGQAYVLLTSPDRQPHLDSIVVARNIPPGPHTLQVKAYLSYDRWALAGIAVGTPPATPPLDRLLLGGLLVFIIGGIGTLFFGRRLPWGRLNNAQISLTAYARQMTGFVFGIAVSIVTGIGLVLTWGGALPNLLRRDPPAIALVIVSAGLVYFSPALIVTLVSLLALFLVIYQRPPLGLALTLFWAPFFLFPIQLYVSAATMVEVSLAITLLATVARGVVTWFSQPDRKLPTLRLRITDWLVVAFAIVAVLTVFWSAEREPAIRELRTIVIDPVIFYFLFRVIAIERRDVLRIVDALLLAGLAVCLIGFGGYFHIGGVGGVVVAEQGSERLSSVYGSPNNVALFLGRCIPFALAMALFPLSNLRRIAATALAIIMLIAVILTQSAGALVIGLPAAVVVIVLAWHFRTGLRVTVALAALGGGGLILLNRFDPRFQGFISTRASTVVRTELWHSALNLIREHPLTGAGLDQFLYLYRSRYILPDAYKEPDLSHPHNLILDYWISLGIAGLALLVGLQLAFWSNVITAYRAVRRGAAGHDPLLLALAVGAMGSMADFLAHGMVDNSYFVIDLSFVFCFTLALAGWLRHSVAPAHVPAPVPASIAVSTPLPVTEAP